MVDKKSIPEWQKQSGSAPSEADAVDLSPDNAPSPEQSSRSDLLEQAKTFLAHEDIRDSTTESKISFLEEKGLTNAEIHELLGISRNEPAAPEPAADIVQQPQLEVASSETVPVPNDTPSPAPIITYPEFLLHASKPPPLITPTRVANALYAGSVVGATIYGVSKFVLQPMFESLSDARHDLFSSTKDQLESLNEKLETVVSSVPAAAKVSNIGHERRRMKQDDDSDDESSVVSDPTELFHRDVGVQTSPVDEEEENTGNAQAHSITTTAEKLSTLRGHLNTLLHSSSTSLNASEKAKTEVKETEVYLDQLRYGSGGTGYGALSGDDGWRNQVFGSKVAGGGNKKADAVEEFKTDIRLMKGTLLSARNFPRGGGSGR